jgi:hypothetical protein
VTRTARALTAVLLSPLALAGCADDSGGDAATMGEVAVATGTAAESPTDEPSDEPATEPAQDPSTEPAPTEAPASGRRISGDGYSYAVPDGWQNISAAMKKTQPMLNTAAGEPLSDVEGIRDNMNVVLIPGLTLAAYEAAAPGELKFMVDDLTILPRTTVADEASAHVGGVATTGGVTFWFEQYAVEHDGRLFSVSFAVDQDSPEAERRAQIDSVLTSWRWA